MPKVNRRPGPAELRRFGWTILAGFALIGAAFWASGHPAAAERIWIAAGTVGALAVLLPRASLPFYWAWMGIGLAVGSVTSRLAMGLIFYGVLTPLGLFFKLKGRDALRLKKPEGSCWTDHPKLDDPSYYDHLF